MNECCTGNCDQGRKCPNRSTAGYTVWWAIFSALLVIVVVTVAKYFPTKGTP